MSSTPNLSLPYLEAGQAQKHVTHNEALRALDTLTQLSVAGVSASPPGSPANGERHLVGASPSGAFAGHADEIATFEDGAWIFRAPKVGWRAWNAGAGALFVWTGSAWSELETGGSGLTPRGAWNSAAVYAVGDLVEHEGHLFASNVGDNTDNEPQTDPPASSAEWTYVPLPASGSLASLGDVEIDSPQDGEALVYEQSSGTWVNAEPPGGAFDPDNVPYLYVNGAEPEGEATRLAARSNDVLVHAVETGDGGSGDVRLQLSKEDSASKTASVFFSRDFSGRAEFGLVGGDSFRLKVSANGTSWTDALVADPATGAVEIPQGADLGAAKATAAQFRANTADKVLVTDRVFDAAASVALTDAATISVDFSAGWNFHVTLGGNRTLGNPGNVKKQSGVIKATASGATRTLDKGSNWKSAGITWPVSIASGQSAYVFYFVDDASNIIVTGVVNNPA